MGPNLFVNYYEAASMILFGIGFTTMLLHPNLVKKIIGLNIMDTAIYLFLAAKGYIEGKLAPIIVNGDLAMETYINPIPSIRLNGTSTFARLLRTGSRFGL